MARCMTAAMMIVLSAATLAPAQIKLEHKLRDSSTSETTAVTKTHQILKVAGMDVETKSEQTIVTETKTAKRDEQGNLRATTEIKSLKAKLGLPGGVELEFDSAKQVEPQGTQFDFVLELLKATAKTKITSIHGKDNKVISIEVDSTEIDKLDETSKVLIKSQLEPEHLAKAANQELNEVPSMAVSKGDMWERTSTMQLEAGQSLTFKNAYKYEGAMEHKGKLLDKISVVTKEVTYAMDNPEAAVKVTGSKLKVESSDGAILFDRELGRVAEQNSKIKIKGDMTFDANGTELEASLELSLEINKTTQ